jgi:predicted transposase YdaD
MTASDKLFHWLFQSQPNRILQLLPELAAAEADGYRFMAPVFKALEHRPDGVFLAVEEASALPALVLEAQMWADPEFFLRIYAESGRFLQQQKTIRRWQVVVICPRRTLAFGDPEPVAEFLEHRVRWLELQPALADPDAPPLLRTLALLLEKEERLPATTAEIRARVAGTELERQIADATAAILLARFTSRPIPEICAMAGITLEDFSQSVAYKEIFGLGEQRGRELGLEQGLEQGLEKGLEQGLEKGLEKGLEQGLEQGLKTGELEITLRQLRRRCGALTATQEARIRALPLSELEALAEALLDFQGADDLNAWLAAG